MSERADLQIRVTVSGGNRAANDLDRIGKKAKETERATDGLAGSLGTLVGTFVATASITALSGKLVSVTRQFDILNAGLQTATGSADNAKIAFQAIQDFATQTPYSLQQATDAFTKLVNYGLTPSEEAMRSYGDTAAALGKDLNQMVEAVADAATGEFERLKEFGIKARNNGATVAFTFRGVTTTVKNNAKEIEGYLIKLGQNNFAGQMEKRMNTLDGAISNLGDEWNKFFLNVSQQGVGDAMEEGVRTAISALAELNAEMASGQTQGYLKAISDSFVPWGQDIASSLDVVKNLFGDSVSTWKQKASDGLDAIIDGFRHLPQNVRAFIQLLAVEIGSIVDYGRAYGKAYVSVMSLEFEKLVDKGKLYGQALGEALNPFGKSTFNLDQELARLDRQTSDATAKAFENARAEANAVVQGRKESIIAIIEERDAAVKSFDDQIAKADELRKKYDEETAARQKNGKDRLAQFGINAPVQNTLSPAQLKAAAAKKKQMEQQLEQVKEYLMSEEEAITFSYEKRLKIIQDNLKAGTSLREELENKLKAAYAKELQDYRDQELQKVNSIRDSLLTAEQLLTESYERRKKIVLENTQLTEEQKQQLISDLHANYLKKQAEMEAQKNSVTLQNNAKLFDELAGVAKTFAGEQSALYKGMFAASKAFAIADAIIKIQQGLANASSLPWPSNLAAMASVAAQTAGILSTIQGTSYSGAYDNGGLIPAGKVGLVGEIGPELVQGPAQITSRRDTAKMLKEAASSGNSPSPTPIINLKNINVLDPSIVGDYLSTDEGEKMIMNVVQRNQNALGF